MGLHSDWLSRPCWVGHAVSCRGFHCLPPNVYLQTLGMGKGGGGLLSGERRPRVPGKEIASFQVPGFLECRQEECESFGCSCQGCWGLSISVFVSCQNEKGLWDSSTPKVLKVGDPWASSSKSSLWQPDRNVYFWVPLRPNEWKPRTLYYHKPSRTLKKELLLQSDPLSIQKRRLRARETRIPWAEVQPC